VTKTGKTKKILCRRGVFQGAGLSPFIFNIAVNHIFTTLSESQVAEKFGFKVADDLPKQSICRFADDTNLMSSSLNGIKQLALMAIRLFEDCGFEINFQKSTLIAIEKGKPNFNNLFMDGHEISSIKEEETIKYLGVTFKDEIVFDQEKTILNFQSKLENLVATPTLRSDQKIDIINIYLWPILIYPLMTAPLNKLPKTFLNRVDIIIKSAVKEILSIPTDTPDALLYTSNKLRGLSIARAHWEAYLQHLNICIVLINSGNQYIPHCRDIEQEMDTCFKNLGFDRKDYDEVDMRKLTKTLRLDLREKIFLDWTQMSLKAELI